MNTTLNSETLYADYLEEIRGWNWEYVLDEIRFYSTSPDHFEDDGDGNRYVYIFIGSVFSLTPSGKIYTFWTTNQTEEDVVRDEAWWDALETVSEQNGCFVASPDGCGGDDIFLCKRFDTPEEDGDDEDD